MTNRKSLIVKIGMMVILFIYLFLLYRSDYARDVSMEQITASMEKIDSITALDQGDRMQLRRCYQIDGSGTDGYFFYKAKSSMSVEEAFIIKVADKTQAESLLANAQSHLDSQKNVFGSYGTDQMALLSNAAVGSKGNYVYYFCGADAAAWQEAFLSLI